ncbi:hypothetical protein GCM10009779_03480 [Polymorphospora rubra]|uniref:Glycosyltransferase RgtA/B/C/D-like domain-containing protein n=1 Tax=Polymorphospora rubra TaxID=338584 RepID=A0A810MYF1_9ACTN|nr:hypothetical protein Prubr_26310 [Polymorphospora rubra]
MAPAVAFAALVHALRPPAGTTAPLRLAVVRAALTVGAYAVLVVEGLGALGALTAPAVALAWLLFLAGAGALAGLRRRRSPDHRPWAPTVDRLRDFRRTATRGELLLAGGIGVLVLAELVVALLAEPNNFDSQTYHLPKIERWVAQADLTPWPTAIHRQVTIPPGAEYLLLHLRLLTGGDALYNLLQWAAGIGCLLLVARIVAQLGGGRRAQLLAAFLIGTTPMVTLQATSTQTDLVVAAWTAGVATLALDGLRRRATAGEVLALGAATGLIAITKTSGLLGAAPMLVLWGVAQLRVTTAGPAPAAPPDGGRLRGTLRTVGASVAILLVAATLAGPFLIRMTADFDHPLGPPRLRESVPMQRHDPQSILVNGLRIAHTALDTPIAPLRDASAAAIGAVARLVGVDPQDRAITFGTTTFPVRSWYPDEDRVAFPLAGTLCLIGGALALLRPRRITPAHAGALRAYAVAVGVAVLLHVSTIKWQPWGNRLILFALVLAAPLAALWLDALFGRRARIRAEDGAADTDRPRKATGRRSVAVGLAVVMLAGSALAGVLAISYGFPRRLVGAGSLLTTSDWDTRFLRRPHWAEEFRWAARQVDEAGARRVGLVQQNDNWEYPWWLLLRDGAPYGRSDREIVALQSVLPDRPAADPGSVDAIVCTGNRDVCADLVPDGWRLEFRGYVGYAVPPT